MRAELNYFTNRIIIRLVDSATRFFFFPFLFFFFFFLCFFSLSSSLHRIISLSISPLSNRRRWTVFTLTAKAKCRLRDGRR